MLLRKETKEKYGYEVDDLARTTTKPVCVLCDYCGEEYESSPKRRDHSNKILDKDACKDCRYKKRDELGIIKHGAKNPFQWKHVKEKIQETNREKYGCDWACQNEEVKQKIQDSIFERFGETSAARVPEIREKTKQTLIEKYGVEAVLQHPEFLEKAQNTNVERYGAKSYIESEEGRERIRKTNQEKYGVDNVFQNDQIKEKIRESRIASGNIRLYQGKDIKQWAEELGYNSGTFKDLVCKHGFETASKMTPQISSIESVVIEWLKDIDIDHDRQMRFNYDGGYYMADIVIKNVVVECDGLYWHSDAVCDKKQYHHNKRSVYINNGFHPLFFRQDEIINKFDIVKSIILHRLGRSRTIGARKLSVMKTSKREASQFCEENHLMGAGRGDAYCLHDGKTIYCLMRGFVNKNGELKIDRFCCKSGWSVSGGFSRLLKQFVNEFNPAAIVNMVDLRYGTGDHLKSMGFELINCDLSFRWTNGSKSLHRMKFRGNSGYDNGWAKIWDCGQAKYVKTL